MIDGLESPKCELECYFSSLSLRVLQQSVRDVCRFVLRTILQEANTLDADAPKISICHAPLGLSTSTTYRAIQDPRPLRLVCRLLARPSFI